MFSVRRRITQLPCGTLLAAHPRCQRFASFDMGANACGERRREATDHQPIKLKVQSPVPSDIEVSQSVKPALVKNVFMSAFDIREDELFSFGPYKGKLGLNTYKRLQNR